MTEVVPSCALSEVSLRLLCHDDTDTLKHLCGDWFPVECPDSWYRDITSNKKFFSLAAAYTDHISTTAQDHFKAIYLHVLTTNNTAINFYENRDFKQHHYLPYYYSIHGVLKDGFTFIFYINGGHPSWTILDYIQHLGSALANLNPCSIPHRIYHQAHSLL
ncbi:N-acetyltransferase 15 [Myotis brandtii]|uniref:histone acetyltransferase n=1 Tax=Myotis brandtii TaxID=109478 RepID=S7Q5Z2_MYOBR|nr:N-acetyltransferase 15 [Myotis brandtii]